MRRLIVGTLLLMLCLHGFSQDKMPGHYWDKGGVKHVGKLKPKFHTHMWSGVTVKFYQKKKKVGQLTKFDMSSFVWGKDSFALIHSFHASGTAYYKEDFAKVVRTGKINLYRHWRKVTNSMGPDMPAVGSLISVYLVQEKGTKTYHGIYNRKQFEQYFLPLIEDDKELTERILAMKKREWVRSLSAFVREYNSRQ